MKDYITPRPVRGFFRFRLLALVFALFTAIISCTEFDEMGLDLVDHRIQVGLNDTLSIHAYSVLEDSVLTSFVVPDHPIARHLLGYYNDSLFGQTRASIYTETRPLTTGARIAGELDRNLVILDSVVLAMAYDGWFGDTLAMQDIKVYELNEPIPAGAIYSSRELVVKPRVLNDQYNENTTYRFAPTQKVQFIAGTDTLTVVPHLRLRLNDDFGQRFINATANDFSSVPNFLNFFKGFKITSEAATGQGGVAYFQLGAAVSTLLVYYRHMGDTVFTRSRIAEFPINEFARRYSQFENFDHEHTSPLIRNQVIDGDTIQGQVNVFAQAMGNYKVKIQIPHLQHIFRDQLDQVIINSAQLILPLDKSLINDPFGYAQNLLLFRQDAEGNNVLPRDYFLNPNYFGGAYNEKKNAYIFNLTQHVQGVINGEINNTPLRLIVGASAENAARVVLSGTHADDPIRLEIKYTEPVR